MHTFPVLKVNANRGVADCNCLNTPHPSFQACENLYCPSGASLTFTIPSSSYMSSDLVSLYITYLEIAFS